MMTAGALAAFPVLAGIIGALIVVFRTPSEALVSGVQHFAAGVVLAAVAGEVLPELRERGPLWLIVIGFAAGVAVPLAMRHIEGGESGTASRALLCLTQRRASLESLEHTQTVNVTAVALASLSAARLALRLDAKACFDAKACLA